tara:strand:+ start:2809 stop:3129 length:321 start_codon:yes stop_codon:yes gene_type:complete
MQQKELITHYMDVTDETTAEQIDWNNIQFLTAIPNEKHLIIQCAENVRDFTGYGVAIAYILNFKRVVKMFGGEELIEQMSRELLWDIGVTLVTGNPVPLLLANPRK